MKITGSQRLDQSLMLLTNEGMLRLKPYSPDVVRITYTLAEVFCDDKSLIVTGEPETDTVWDYEDNEHSVVLRTKRLQLNVCKKSGAITYLDQQGHVLVREPKSGGKTLVPHTVELYQYDGSTETKTTKSVDGIRVQAAEAKEIIEKTAYHSKLSFEWTSDEALYGLGQHEEGIMNLRGTSQYLYQQNLKAVVPVLLSSKGYGILMDCCSMMIFRDDMHGSYWWSDVVDELDYYFVYGPEADQIVSHLRQLTGRSPMLPKWSFGYIQSKERYKTQAELLDVVEEYRQRRIPLDSIILDWMSWPGDYWGQKTLDPTRFPEPDRMTEQLHRLQAKLMISIWPIMTNDGPNQLELKSEGCLLGNLATYNAFDEKARKLYWKQAYEGLFIHGIDGWWCDCTEPFDADWLGEVKPEPEQRLFMNTGKSKQYLDPGLINAFSLLHSQGMYEGQRGVTNEKRVINLTRSSYAGQQRYATITWSGDTSAKWEEFRKQIPAGLNFSAAGQPYWTSDIGAFFVGKKEQWFWNGDYDLGCEDPCYRELYVRWFQYGTFLPMFRSHGTDTPREVWRFGEPGTVYYDTLVAFIRLRYRLLPYIYTLAGWVTQQHYTMMRPLIFDFAYDSNVFPIGDQYMFGPALMVCPVTESGFSPLSELTKGDVPAPVTRSVYLPEGYAWYDFWSGKRYEGGQTITVEVPMERMPLFVRSGSIIPLGPDVQHSADQPDGEWKLLIYPGSDGHFQLYEDEGDSYRYEQGEYATTELYWLDQEQSISFGQRHGTYRNMPEKRQYDIHLMEEGFGIAAALHNEGILKHCFDGRAQTCRFNSKNNK